MGGQAGGKGFAMGLAYDWDEDKNVRNIAERKLPFGLCHHLFQGPTLERRDIRKDYGEIRIQAIGAVQGEVLFCVYTDRVTMAGPVRWIISLRKASRRERREYHGKLQGEAPG